jgi:hypothetical protein
MLVLRVPRRVHQRPTTPHTPLPTRVEPTHPPVGMRQVRGGETMTTRISVNVELNDPDLIARAVEALTRTAVGISLEGVDVYVAVCPVVEEDAEVEG